MKYGLLTLTLFIFSCNTNQKEPAPLEIYDFTGIEPFLNRDDSKTYVVNFWATWCAPCVKELPHFEKIQKNYTDDVEVFLISLDFPHQYKTKLQPFIQKHQLSSKVIVLDDPDMNAWIPKIDSDWGGAIPVTLIYNASKRVFYNRAFTYKELESELKTFLTP